MPEDDQNPTPTPSPTPAPEPDFKSQLSKHEGNALRLAEKLYEENFKYREKIRALKGNQAPKDALILTGDDVQAWNRYKALGPLDEVERDLTAGRQSMEELSGVRKAEAHSQVAKAHGYKASVLSRLIDQEKLDVALEEDPRTRKPQAVVKGQDKQGKETRTPLPLFLEQHPVLKDYLPALQDKPAPPVLGTPPPASHSRPTFEQEASRVASLYGTGSPL